MDHLSRRQENRTDPNGEKNKKVKKISKDSLRSLWDHVNQSIIHLIGVLERTMKRGRKTYLKNQGLKTPLIWGRKEKSRFRRPA